MTPADLVSSVEADCVFPYFVTRSPSAATLMSGDLDNEEAVYCQYGNNSGMSSMMGALWYGQADGYQSGLSKGKGVGKSWAFERSPDELARDLKNTEERLANIRQPYAYAVQTNALFADELHTCRDELSAAHKANAAQATKHAAMSSEEELPMQEWRTRGEIVGDIKQEDIDLSGMELRSSTAASSYTKPVVEALLKSGHF